MQRTDLPIDAILPELAAIDAIPDGRYEAEETLERIQREQGTPMSEAAATESSYVCMAEYLARAIAVGLFARTPPKAAPSRN